MENLVNSSPLILVLVFLVIGFAFLMKGADFFVEGSSSIAKRLKVPPIIIGLTIVAMGTSLPETAVSVTASLVNNNELAVSNVVGSNIFNLMVVVGVCSILTRILVQKETIKRDIPFSMICAFLLLGLGILAVGDKSGMTLGHLDGMILLGFFAGYIVAMIQSAMKARAAGKNVEIEGIEELEEEIGILSWPKSILFIVGGALAIAFGGDLTVDAMVMGMRFRFPEKKIIPGKTLIFLDEIQECQEAVTSLKFWAIDNKYDVIVSGSLLGIDYKRASSYPVGYVDYLKMYGIDFEEFLWGMGISGDMIENLCGYLRSKMIVPEAIHSQMMNYYRQYIAIGGMPEAVQKYIDTKDFREIDRIQRSLLQGYQYDIAHYATAEEKVKAEKCYLSLAKQLLDKENHKFQYKEVEHGGRAQKYFSSIEWLLRADMVHLCKLVTDVRFDLDDYARDDFFRAYTTDLSLLMAMKDFH